jgi:nucleoside-diphosphate-sugar epimerase|tara:strand:- start:123 stop:1037 length:915 start_codon:yes stop_codon:yes gene_type:complete
MKEVLILGGTGFIGTNLLKKLDSKSLNITLVGNKGQNKTIKDINYIFLNGKSMSEVKYLTQTEFSYVINLMGYIDHSNFFASGRDIVKSHLIELIGFIENMNKDNLKKFVQIGSSDEYSNEKPPQKEEKKNFSFSPYSFAKSASTDFLRMLNKTDNFPAVTLRLFLVYGPHQKNDRFIPQLINGCLENIEIPMTKGEQIRDFCFVDDVCEAIIACLDNEKVNGEIINIASGIPISIKSMAIKIQDLIGKGTLKIGDLPDRSNTNQSLYADNNLARNLLNWTPNISLEQGLKKSIDFYKSLHESK